MAIASREITVQLYTPHAIQRKVHLSKARFRVVTCGRRIGKTFLGCNEITKFACEHKNALCAWVAPTYRQSKIAYRLIKQALAQLIQHTSDSELLIELPNGARIIFCSSDNYDALRGLGIHFLVLDECADIAEKAWTEVLRPTLSDTRGKALFLGTPKGRNFFYVLFQRGLDPEYQDWESFTAPTAANPYIPKEEVEAAKRELPEMVFEQEYLAVFLEENAGVFRGVGNCVSGELEDPIPGHSYEMGWDVAKHQDFSVITVIDTSTKHVVFWERTNHVDYTVQIVRVVEIAKRYDAHVIMDVTGVGDPLLEQLQRRGLYVDGYLFTNASKKTLIEDLVIAIEHVYVTFPELPVLIGELQSMEYTLSPSRLVQYSAPPGAHDDTVISLALAYHGAKDGRMPSWADDAPPVQEVRTAYDAMMEGAKDPFAYADAHGWADDNGGEW